MAGSGRRVFAAGEVLTASNVMNYLQDQAVMLFANSTDRASTITAPSEGMTTYRTDADVIEVYNGSAWANGLPIGAWLTWTPAITNFTTGNGTATGTYTKIGKTVIARGRFTAGSTTNLNGTPVVSLPVNSKITSAVATSTGGWAVSGNQYLAHIEIIGATGFAVYIVGTTGTYASRVGPSGMSFPSGSTFDFQLVYEAAD